jgi:hypothetical protein
LLVGERSLLDLISTGAPLAHVLDMICAAFDLQMGNVVSLVLLSDDEEHTTLTIAQSAAHFGLSVFRCVAIAFAVAGHALSVETGFVTTVPKCEESAASGENLPASLPVDYLITALPELKRRPGKREVSLESISSESDSTAEHIATMKRMLAAASSVPSHQLQIHTVGKEPSSAPNLTQTAASMNRVFSYHGSCRAPFRGLQPSLKVWCSSWRTSFPWTVSTVMWSRLSLSVVPMIRESIHTARKLLRRWTSEFRRDWMAMVNAIAFAQIRKFFLHWWRQPLSSKTLESRKN